MRRFRIRSMTAAAAVVAAVGLAVPPVSAAPAPADDAPSCHKVSLPIDTLPRIAGTRHMSGELCTPASGPSSTIQLLVPGATYNHSYWNWPDQRYSYVRSAAAHGFSTLSIDRFNTGDSDRLPSALVSDTSDAVAVHQIIGKLRTGEVGGRPHGKVALVGHSLGSIIAVRESAMFNDADALLLTAYAHTVDPGLPVRIATGGVVVPAPVGSPRLASQPAGDLSTPKGERGPLFYGPKNSSKETIEHDEANKDVLTATEFAEFPVPTLDTESDLIKIPVFHAMGSDDGLFKCNFGPCSNVETMKAAEAPRFPAAKNYTPYVLRDAGHSLNMHENNADFFTETNAWVRKTLG